MSGARSTLPRFEKNYLKAFFWISELGCMSFFTDWKEKRFELISAFLNFGEVLPCLHLCVCFDLKKWRHTICYAYYYYVSYFLHIHKVVTSRRMFNFWTWEVIFYSWTFENIGTVTNQRTNKKERTRGLCEQIGEHFANILLNVHQITNDALKRILF